MRTTMITALLLFPAFASAQAKPDTSHAGMAGMDHHSTAAAVSSMSGPMHDDPHMLMTPKRVATASDSARAAAIVVEARHALERYKDVHLAESDGFKQFLPNVKQPVYHFTSYKNGFLAGFRFDAAKPTSLLYRKNADGTFALIGAMYTARQGAALGELDQRIPLGIAHWHEHVNWCLPKSGETDRWSETRDGKLLFGPASPVATYQDCRAINGDFHKNVFGWMVHANLFESDDPSSIWNADHH